MTRFSAFLAAVAATAFGVASCSSPSVTIDLGSSGSSGSSGTIIVEVATASSFRLGVSSGPSAPTLASPSLDPARKPAVGEPVAWGGMKGVKTSFGALLAASDGRWALYDHNNDTLVQSRAPPSFDGGVVTLAVNATPGAGHPCLGNGEFGPPFHWDRTKGFQV